MKLFRPDEEEYRASRRGTVFARIDRGVIRGVGADRLDLLHRLSTNAVKDLRPGRETATILTSDKGRIVEVTRVVALDDALLLLQLGAEAEPVRAWLDKYTIMDDFTTEDVSDRFSPVGVYGERARDLIASLFGVEPPDAGAFAIGEGTAGRTLILRDQRLSGAGAFLLLVDREAIEEVVAGLIEGGATEIGEGTLGTLRVEAGVPAFGAELSERYNPLEAGLTQYISFTKGCYIGQEVIARLDTYDKVQRHLVGIVLEEGADIPSEGEVELFDPHEGKKVGTLTSAAWSPDLGRMIALGYVRAQHAVPGLDVVLRYAGSDGSGEQITGPVGIITKLPFDL